MFLYSPEETFDIWLHLELSKVSVAAYIEAISGFSFHGCLITKSSFAKVGSCKLNENHGSLLAE